MDEVLKGELRERLRERFTKTDLIDTLLRRATGIRLFDEYATEMTPKNQVIKILVDAMADEGTLNLFLKQVYDESKFKPELRNWLRDNFPGMESLPSFAFQEHGQAAGSTAALQSGLQRYVQPGLPPMDVFPWLASGAANGGRVCRVELNRSGIGTGFLIGRDLVLTNWHVVRKLVPGNKTDDLACRFDFAASPGGGVSDGQPIDVAEDGILAWSPAAVTEMPEVAELPQLGPDTLDYALLKLDEPIGDKRGWFDLSGDAPKVEIGHPLIIIQHPFAAPLKLALDTRAVLAPIPPGLRLRYATNTEHGSSGSPVLTLDWRLVALHHLGDPTPGKPAFNEGIPIGLIRDALHDQGHGALIVAP